MALISQNSQLIQYKMLKEGVSSSKKQKVIFQTNFYTLDKVVGQGTFGKVYEGTDTRNGLKVAIKEVYQDKRYKNRELDVISRLDNDNVIYMKDYYLINRKEEKYLYIVMDYFETNLQALFKQNRKNKTRIAPEIRKVMIFQLFKALYYLENNNVCHRDLKPPNILINPQTSELKICDFGSAKIFDKNQKNVAYICSRYYRAPQLLFDYPEYKTEIDVWSAGCIIVQFLTLEAIFPGDSSLEQLIEIIKIIGSPSKQYLEKYAKQVNQQVKFPDIPNVGWQRLLKKYHPQPQFIDLISKILVFQRDERWNPIQILMHPYFKDLNSKNYAQFHTKLPYLLDFDRLRNPRNAKEILMLQQKYMMENPKHPLKNSKQIENKEEKLDTSDCTPQIQKMQEQIQ